MGRERRGCMQEEEGPGTLLLPALALTAPCTLIYPRLFFAELSLPLSLPSPLSALKSFSPKTHLTHLLPAAPSVALLSQEHPVPFLCAHNLCLPEDGASPSPALPGTSAACRSPPLCGKPRLESREPCPECRPCPASPLWLWVQLKLSKES